MYFFIFFLPFSPEVSRVARLGIFIHSFRLFKAFLPHNGKHEPPPYNTCRVVPPEVHNTPHLFSVTLHYAPLPISTYLKHDNSNVHITAYTFIHIVDRDSRGKNRIWPFKKNITFLWNCWLKSLILYLAILRTSARSDEYRKTLTGSVFYEMLYYLRILQRSIN